MDKAGLSGREDFIHPTVLSSYCTHVQEISLLHRLFVHNSTPLCLIILPLSTLTTTVKTLQTFAPKMTTRY